MSKNMQKIAAVVMACTLLQPVNVFAKATSIKKPYNVKVTANRLNVRNKPSMGGKVVAKYTKGSVVSIVGQVDNYLKTNKGYIHYSYTQNYLSAAKVEPNIENKTEVKKEDGRYIVVNKDSQLITNTDINTLDERYAVKDKKYKLIEETDKYYKIKIGKISGYISKDNASILATSIKENITLGWDYVYSKANNKYLYDSISDPVRRSSAAIGLDALSPTWFDMIGDPKKPVLVDKADNKYMAMAHKNGYEVWPRFCEMNPDRAYVIFNNSTIREQVISSVVAKAIQYNVDGINIDFEGIGSRNKNGLTAFTRDLSARLSAVGISTSIDVTKPDGSDKWSLCYDRPQLAKYVDYIALMAYDEHTAGSPGPNGSYPWVEDAIKKTIAQGVPGEKILLGIPFYMRDYTVNDLKVPTGTVVFGNQGKIYKTPNASDSNRLLDAKKGYNFKVLATINNDWLIVDCNGVNGYIKPQNASIVKANISCSPTDLMWSSDVVISKSDTAIYKSANSSDSEKVADIKLGSVLKVVSKTDDGNFYLVDSGIGTNAYIPATSCDFIPMNTFLSGVNPNINLSFNYDMAVVQNDCKIYLTPNESDDNVLKTANTNEYFKYLLTDGNFYAIRMLSGDIGYVSKSIASYKGVAPTVVKSSAMGIQAASNLLSGVTATKTYDSKAKQYKVEYYKGGYKHNIWLENAATVAWRSDFVSKYNLKGIGIWSLTQTPTEDIWNVINTKLKSK